MLYLTCFLGNSAIICTSVRLVVSRGRGNKRRRDNARHFC